MNNVNQIFFWTIGLMVLFFLVAELRLSFRYKALLKNWYAFLHYVIKVDDERISDSEPILKRIAQRYFLYKEDAEGLRLSSDHGLLLVTHPVESFVPSNPASPYRFVPALLTTIGVLGTFLGISLGLADFQAAGGSSQALMNSATNLLEGMKTAFYTSLAGLSASICFMIWHAMLSKMREKSHRSVVSALSSRCLPISPVNLLNKMTPESNDLVIEKQVQASNALLESNKNIATAIVALERAFSGFGGSELVTKVAEAVQMSVENAIAPPLERISEELGLLKVIKEQNANEIVEMMISSIRDDIVAPMVANSVKASSAIETLTSSNQLLTGKVGDLVSSLDSTLTTLNHFQEDTLNKLQHFAVDLASILRQFKDDTEGVLKRIGDEVNLAMTAAINGLKLQSDAFAESTEKASEAFLEQNNILKEIGVASSNLMNDAKMNLVEGLANIDTKVASMSSVVQSELERFRISYQDNLQAFFHSQESLLEKTLGEQREGLSQVISDYRIAFTEEFDLRKKQYEAVDLQYKSLQEGVGCVQELVEAVGFNKASSFSQIEDTARAISSQVGKLRLAFEESAERFNKIVEEVPEAMSEYFASAKQTNVKFFGDFDEAAAKVHGKLADAANLLVTAMQQIDMQTTQYQGSAV